MRSWQRKRLMLALSVGVGLMLGPRWAHAQDGRQAPAALLGIWYSTPDCRDHRIMRLEFEPRRARANGMDGKTTCNYAGERQITPTRWYLDLECANGRRIVHLDINVLDDGRLLVAHRPLGEACFYGPPGR